MYRIIIHVHVHAASAYTYIMAMYYVVLVAVGSLSVHRPELSPAPQSDRSDRSDSVTPTNELADEESLTPRSVSTVLCVDVLNTLPCVMREGGRREGDRQTDRRMREGGREGGGGGRERMKEGGRGGDSEGGRKQMCEYKYKGITH